MNHLDKRGAASVRRMRRLGRRTALVATLVTTLAPALATTLVSDGASAQPLARAQGPKVRPRLDPRLVAASSPRFAGGARLPLVARFDRPLGQVELGRLEARGAVVERRRDGSPRVLGPALDRVALRAGPADLARLAEVPGLVRLALDRPVLRPPPPVDHTIEQVEAPALWRAAAPVGPLTGAGVTLCDIDSGIDPFHPLFFRADAGYYTWLDVDADGAFTPGVDEVEVDGARVVLRVQDSVVSAYWSPEPMFGSDAPGLDARRDHLFADVDASGAREVGFEQGFGDDVPALGEPLFVVDDVDGDGVLDLDEKLVRLGSSKIKTILAGDGETYRRGESLSRAPVTPDVAHGCGAAGVLAGGHHELGAWAGVAPDADLVVVALSNGHGDVYNADFCMDEGAKVVLHEYAPWVGYHLDGSSNLEQLIDESFLERDVLHVNPAGNLATGNKLSKRELAAGGAVTLGFTVPEGLGATAFLGSLLWRDPSRELAFVLTSPSGQTLSWSSALVDTTLGPYRAVAFRDDSTRGTARADWYVFEESASPAPIEPGSWTLDVSDPGPSDGPPITLYTYLLDEVSGWGAGIVHDDFVSLDHLVGYPGTADYGLVVTAYTGNGWHGATPDQLADYTGRGTRIDGAPLAWISAPDDPISAGYWPDRPGSMITFGGTSGASPHVAGAAALLFQHEPSRSAASVKQALADGALVDAITGDVPNERWGHGRLRAHRAAFGVEPEGGSAPTLEGGSFEVPALTPTTLALDVSDVDGDFVGLSIDDDYDGLFDRSVSGASFEVSLDVLPDGGEHVLKVRAVDATGRATPALVRVRAVVAPVGEGGGGQGGAAPRAEVLYATGGGGCSVAAGRAGPFGLGALAALGALALRRRRRAA